MAFTHPYVDEEPARDAIDALPGPTVLEFGAPWCGHCLAAEPLVRAALSMHPQVRHIRIEDGPRRPLGRSYRIKLWPTLVFLRDGREHAREVRPASTQVIVDALVRIDSADSHAGRPEPRE